MNPSNWNSAHERLAFRSRNVGGELSTLSAEEARTKLILYSLGELVTEYHLEAESRGGRTRTLLRENAWSLDAIRIDLASGVIGNDYARIWLDSGRDYLAKVKGRAGHHE